jgi:hypothetical protein
MVAIGGIHREQLVLHSERGLSPGLDFMRLGKSETKLA